MNQVCVDVCVCGRFIFIVQWLRPIVASVAVELGVRPLVGTGCVADGVLECRLEMKAVF